MVKQQEIQVDLDDLNDSELVQLCYWVGIKASRAWPRALLLSSLENFEPVDIEQPLDKERYSMSEFLKLYWDRVRMQVGKKVCPNCFECREIQILDCHTKNKRHIGGK